MTPMLATHQTRTRSARTQSAFPTEGDRKVIRLVRDTLRDSPVADLERFECQSQSERDYRHQMRVNFLAAIVLVVVIIAGSWIVQAIAETNRESPNTVRILQVPPSSPLNSLTMPTD